jgi:hypothetical protein
MPISVLVSTILSRIAGAVVLSVSAKAETQVFFFLKKGTGALPLIKVEEAKCDLQSTRPIRLHLGLIILTQPLYRGPD